MACGAGLVAPASASAGSGGAFASAPPTIKSISCVAGCATTEAAKPGSLLRVRGTHMREIAKIVFLGGGGHDDNATVRVSKTRRDSVDVTVPEKATSGRLRAVNADGARSAASRAVISIQRGAGGGAALDVKVIGRRVYLDAARPARVDLLARQAMAVTVALVRVIDGAVVTTWPLVLEPEAVSSVTWDGRVAGVAQPAGRYEFRVFDGDAGGGSGAVAASVPSALASGGFDLVDHIFPVRGRHSYGSGQATFGAERNGHTHQGHDVFARCGTPMVAARGGVVKLNRFERSAGNYIVIDCEGTDIDYVYMHLAAPSPLAKGARVLTGQPIGNVGDTGDAHGCHLHFELWSGPGWYTGGAPLDPLPFLKLWDAYS
ncbi:MAG TPA: peptidoglycan DD-metalloendopeptidase family protein [Solirubrobacteraceae bacterium]|nr:peptidoglycan DD-metalloendopeptidase family protein [Solirubrobacteraceae bacterium]